MKRIALLTLAILLVATNVSAAGSIIKKWKGETSICATNLYGGAVADLIAAEVGWNYSGTSTNAIDLETAGYEGVVITVEYTGSGATDSLDIGVFGSLDTSTWDTIPFFQFSVPASAVNVQTSFVIKDYSHIRIGIRNAGTTDTHDYEIVYDAWYWYYN